ncbi:MULTISPECIES: YkgJ family cysteine cluster protein [Pseudothermotoga]|jgi:Fe-S-cluster containining protein|uniref:YkgJ family cysteine cluster protein n=2 Tax=Pseudothermotoga TaxID=1643951 RepID=A8F6T4_PSELT|nr:MULTISPECIES: YkgJ family cysteine cluster protein [Pseudothermotoga]ABV33868.1 hypothetical protein Tlet_1311 [Pseudothermotoga lettingae TMO]MDI3494131.1 hypothetical protein [Pseudothermotoga sp.]MDK2884303.1 hypothetical protein [Pseudothermotoga sp.]GLI49195.1 hypothetical protein PLETTINGATMO_13640 [Pseudothermotoga lettingae TMO]
MIDRITDLSNQILKLYEELNQIQKTFPSCNGCKECCNTPSCNIEATILEFIPLAVHFSQMNLLDKWLDKLERTTEEDICVLFDPANPKGGCTYHIFRPLICRLFSASLVIRKNIIQPLSCKYLRSSLINQITNLPNAQDYFSKLLSIDFFLASYRYPINTALKKALEYVGLYYTTGRFTRRSA